MLHTCYLINDVRFKDRVKIYRHSNIEHEYYNRLADSEKNLFKKRYLKSEAKKLERFEPVISNADYILAVNEDDANYFKKTYAKPKTIYLPSFHPNNEVSIKPGKGNYILYHGNLSVSENYEGAIWLIENVFNDIKYKVIIAGLNPPVFLKNIISSYGHISLIENPEEQKMNELIEDAHIHCLYTEQATGLKLKLLNVMFKGRFVLCNPKMIKGTHLAEPNDHDGLFIPKKPIFFKELIGDLMKEDMSDVFIKERNRVLETYRNDVNIKILLDLI